jgi:hypothetical protein
LKLYKLNLLCAKKNLHDIWTMNED